jgi:hypothetical protein
MTARNLKTRIKKLEASRKHIDEILVVWRLPGADVSEAIANIDYLPGDRVICLEWFGEDPPPAPKWHEDLQRSLSREANDSIDIILKRIIDAKPLARKLQARRQRRASTELLISTVCTMTSSGQQRTVSVKR